MFLNDLKSKLLIFSLLLFFFSSCRPDKRAQSVGRAIVLFEKQIEKDNLSIMGIGEAVNHDTGKQNHIKVILQTNSLDTIDQARALFLHTFDLLSTVVNNNKAIRSYLDEYPFSENNLRISIINKHYDHSKSLWGVNNHKNEICYLKEQSGNDSPLVEIFTETIQEARAKCKQ